MTGDGESLDLWTKTPTGWQLRQTDELSVHETLDGKPLLPEKKKKHAAPKTTPGGKK